MVTFGALWLSGCFWLVLHLFFAQSGQWGPVEHPWSPSALKVHGWIAVASVFLLGWVTALHVSDRWTQTQKRVSGISIASVAAILAVTGYALYYTTDRLHDAAALAHETFGGAAVLLALVHWKRRRPLRRSEAFMPGSRP
jgi:fucose 4-O-acetylase-like acetyltransferase